MLTGDKLHVQVFLVALCTPVNILYRSSRIFFLRCIQRVIFAPFYKVPTTYYHSVNVYVQFLLLS
jgi:hypothetical protein